MNTELHSKHQAPLSVYFCGSEDCAPGHSFGPAVRPHYLLHIILSGQGIYQKDGTIYTLKKGDAFLIPPLVSTYYQADQSDPWSYAWVGFDGSECDYLLSQTVFADSFVFYNDTPASFDTLFSSMLHLVNSFLESGNQPLRSVGNLLLLFSDLQKLIPEKETDFADLYFQKAVDYISNNYSYDIRISEIARHVGIDRTYLYKIFMEQTQLSPKQYLMQHRIRVAAQMLCSTSYPITEIALSCGFQDAPAFCSHFKRHTGSTPGTFRRLSATK
ncbi:MAG: AraC family transcriptional regulator [Marvinbryantia sp.]|jgi:AraC-like DNA-binding protein